MPKNIPMMIGDNLHWLLVLGGTALLGAAISILPHDAEATRAPLSAQELKLPTEPVLNLETLKIGNTSDTQEVDASIATFEESPVEWTIAKVKPGDNLSQLFNRHGLSPQEVYKVTSNITAAAKLKMLYPGEVIKLRTEADALTELSYDFDLGRSLHILRSGDGFDAKIIEKPLEYRTAQVSGEISDSLFLSAQKAGLSDSLTMELANIFGWDIDFALDIRQGDRFAVIYDEAYLEGEKVRDGKIIAATFINQGKSYQAIRYTDASGNTDYYSADGRSMRKAFLRTPVEFSRISSGFNLSRKHPVLNTIRAHKGVDYAAPTGTPIKATGNGKVIHRGSKGGYGNTVIIQHGNGVNTLYAHLSNYARGISNGSRIKQGQVIGYVGSSGLATGPHLHYEFHVNGTHRNPLTVKLPDAQPLDKKYMADFRGKAKQLLASLELLNKTNVAAASSQ